jgi:hypothetical protein
MAARRDRRDDEVICGNLASIIDTFFKMEAILIKMNCSEAVIESFRKEKVYNVECVPTYNDVYIYN